MVVGRDCAVVPFIVHCYVSGHPTFCSGVLLYFCCYDCCYVVVSSYWLFSCGVTVVLLCYCNNYFVVAILLTVFAMLL